MWSSSAGNKSRRKAVSSSTSKSSSTCLCPQTHLTRRSMEEIWKGIDLSILHHHPPAAAAAAATAADDDEAAGNHHAFHGLNLQNLSYLPNSPKEAPKTRDNFRKPPNSGRCGSDAVFQPAPAAVLSSDRMRSDPQSQNHADGGPDPSFLSSLNSPFDALSPSTDPFPSFPKKRASENDDNFGNCRHKRMIKNRESAARSRARKQAYATGLEGEVTRLLEENARLRRQVEKYRLAAAAQIPKKQTLHRTLTAPF